MSYRSSRRKVVHLIPTDGIGGVEIAARSMVGIEDDHIEFHIDYIFREGSACGLNPFRFIAAARRIISLSPDLLIVSLWRSCIVGIFVKLLVPRMRLVLFLHLPENVHWLDRHLTRITAKYASGIWADSKGTLTKRISSYASGRVISFVPRHARPLEKWQVCAHFIFWGRIHPQKGLDRAIHIFAGVYAANQLARFTIVGPDGGDLQRIRNLVDEMGVSEAVDFVGAADFEGIRGRAQRASFYLQTSLCEGMAMSVVEAMQLGLVPIVTAVGEIQNYCKHFQNALVVQDNEAVIEDILLLLSDSRKYSELREGAINTWADAQLYSHSVLQACSAIFAAESADLRKLF